MRRMRISISSMMRIWRDGQGAVRPLMSESKWSEMGPGLVSDDTRRDYTIHGLRRGCWTHAYMSDLAESDISISRGMD
jgi:hypothetical protein